jgi:hypothetical protein
VYGFLHFEMDPGKGQHRTTFLSGQVPNESEGQTAPATWRNSRRLKKGRFRAVD